MSTYPSAIAALTNPNASDPLNAPSHSAIETAQNNNITALENFIGVEGASSIVGTIIYDVRSPASNGGGHVQTVNKGGTGQISFSKGDILVAQSSSVLSKLAIGTTDGQALIVDSTQSTGVSWGVPNNRPTIRIYSVAATSSIRSSTFTWSKPSNLSYIRVRVQAPGGAGSSVAGNSKFSPGGSAGGYAEKVIAVSILSSTERVEVGGAGQVSAGATSISSFGITNSNVSILANPGLRTDAGNNLGTVGGTATGGDINLQGQAGGTALVVGAVGLGGQGGNSKLGMGGPLGYGGSTGVAIQAVGFGSGGSGAASDASANLRDAGQGMPGVVIIEEY